MSNRIILDCCSTEATGMGDWFHAFKFSDGAEVGRSSPLDKFPLLIEGLDIFGKTVLEAGCNAGGMTHLMERQGAAVFPFDVLCPDTGRWGNQFELVKRQLGIKADYHVGDVCTISERADVVFMIGVYYHLRYPRQGIDNMWSSASECLVIEGAVLEGEDRAVAEFPTPDHPYNNDPTNQFIPSRSLLSSWLHQLDGVGQVVELKSLPNRAAYRVERV